jgi:putative membrane protein insertion efficiency factor
MITVDQSPSASDVAAPPTGGRVELLGTGGSRGPAHWLISMVRGYQLARSGRPTGCRYLPTCSEYAIEAIGAYGARRGSALALRRVARCTPWGGHGIDPIPERRAQCRP